MAKKLVVRNINLNEIDPRDDDHEDAERDRWYQHAAESGMTEAQQAKFLKLQYWELDAERLASLPAGTVLQAIYATLARRICIFEAELGADEQRAALDVLTLYGWVEKRNVEGVVLWHVRAPRNYKAMVIEEAERIARQ
jgi:hypothetical protein